MGMARIERYRIWLKNGKYVVAAAKNRDAAVRKAIEEGTKLSSMKSVGKATSRGRQFRISD